MSKPSGSGSGNGQPSPTEDIRSSAWTQVPSDADDTDVKAMVKAAEDRTSFQAFLIERRRPGGAPGPRFILSIVPQTSLYRTISTHTYRTDSDAYPQYDDTESGMLIARWLLLPAEKDEFVLHNGYGEQAWIVTADREPDLHTHLNDAMRDWQRGADTECAPTETTEASPTNGLHGNVAAASDENAAEGIPGLTIVTRRGTGISELLLEGTDPKEVLEHYYRAGKNVCLAERVGDERTTRKMVVLHSDRNESLWQHFKVVAKGNTRKPPDSNPRYRFWYMQNGLLFERPVIARLPVQWLDQHFRIALPQEPADRYITNPPAVSAAR